MVKHDKREVPRLVAIETTNACNAKCAFCPNSAMNRDREVMADDLYRKIIDDCATFGVQAIEPFLNGEPFMDPQIVPRLRYLRERLPATKLRIYTNGFALVPKRVDELQDVGIDHLFIIDHNISFTRCSCSNFFYQRQVCVMR